jgi:Na+-driven multidrug efflux pump
MYLMVTNYVFYAGKTAQLAIVTLISGLFNVGVSYLLIRAHGVIGAAQAFAAAQALLFVLTWFVAQRARPMPWLRAVVPA